MDVLKGDPDSDGEINPVPLKKQFEFVDIKELPAIWKGMKDDPLKIEVCKEETKHDVIIIEEHEVKLEAVDEIRHSPAATVYKPSKRSIAKREIHNVIPDFEEESLFVQSSDNDSNCCSSENVECTFVDLTGSDDGDDYNKEDYVNNQTSDGMDDSGSDEDHDDKSNNDDDDDDNDHHHKSDDEINLHKLLRKKNATAVHLGRC